MTIDGDNIILPFYFKLTTNGVNFIQNLCINTKFNQMKELLDTCVHQEFGLENYDIVIAGTSLKEQGIPIDYTSNITLKQKFSKNIKHIAFYIRPANTENTENTENETTHMENYLDRTNNYPILTNFITRPSTLFQETNCRSERIDCVICLTRSIRSSRLRVLPCGHRFCRGCINNWITSDQINLGRNYCPTCRNSIST